MITEIYIGVFALGVIVGALAMGIGMMLVDPVCIAIRYFQ